MIILFRNNWLKNKFGGCDGIPEFGISSHPLTPCKEKCVDQNLEELKGNLYQI